MFGGLFGSDSSNCETCRNELKSLDRRLGRVEAKLDTLLAHFDLHYQTSTVDVVLVSFGNQKLNVVKSVKAIMNCSLMKAKSIVEDTPSTIAHSLDNPEAQELKRQIEMSGGTVRLESSKG